MNRHLLFSFLNEGDVFGITYKTVVACVLVTETGGQTQRSIRPFSTMTAGLLALADWLESMSVSVVALESTGLYWRPVFNLIEEGRTIILVNAQHMKAVPGRKTDVKDAEWLADLLRHGLRDPRALSLLPPSENSVISRAIARRWCKNERKK
jgi:transposase